MLTARGGTGLIAGFRAAEPVVRLLVLTQLAFNTGFFMVLPYLSTHLADDLGQATAVVGAVLGLRTVSQQGLFFVGGALADRFGTKPVVLAGCGVRTAGFLLLGLGSSLAAAAVGTVLTGLAGALFSPAVESALARSAGAGTAARLDAFALFNAFGQVGAFAGPLVGAVLLAVDFGAVSVAGAAVFVLIGAAHSRWLPSSPAEHRAAHWAAGFGEVLRNRGFVRFAAVMSVQLVAYNQLYLLLPLLIERSGVSGAALGALFAVSALVVVLLQVPLAKRAAQGRPRTALVAGVAAGAAAFGAGAIAQFTVGAVPPWGTVAIASVFVVLLALGSMIAGPTARALIPRFAQERYLGTYYGWFASIAGLVVLPASALIGAIDDVAPDTVAGRGAPWCAMAVVMAAAAATIGCRRPR